MKIYTKQGDEGMSALFGGQKVRKDHPRLAAYGTIDEVNSHLGLSIATCKDAALKAQLETLQHRLFDLGADLATPLDSPHAGKVTRIGPADVADLERQIDLATAELAPLKRFILPGGGLTAGHLHVARSTCRRAERELVALLGLDTVHTNGGGSEISIHSFIFVNRLSDLLFTLARLANKREGMPDVEWNAP
jgi:cob(I)alamin adenosyltransferase